MSVVKSDPLGYLVCHKGLIRKIYKDVATSGGVFDFNMDSIFGINCPFLRENQMGKDMIESRKRKLYQISYSEEVKFLKSNFIVLKENFREVFESMNSEHMDQSDSVTTDDSTSSNDSARASANSYFSSIDELGELQGGNNSCRTIVAVVNGTEYLFPPNCRFINRDLQFAPECFKGSQFDLILMDPPWYNRFVKRRKKSHSEHGYHFIEPTSLSQFPVETILSPEGLVAVWTTNSPKHLEHLTTAVFPSWGVQMLATWFWIKVTVKGELVSDWQEEGVKQPYERLLFASRPDRKLPCPRDRLCLVSVPSAIHSHKPPLSEVVRDYLPEAPKCLEVFARYLQPGWTSLGNQVLSMQRLSLFTKVPTNKS